MDAFKGGTRLTATLSRIASDAARGKEVRVGFLEGASGYPGGQTPAQVAFLNEFGTSRIPARPFFRTMVSKQSPGWGKLMGAALKLAGMDGSAALSIMGDKIKDQLQRSIASNQWAPNAPATIARKGEGKAPLLDTKHMMFSVDFEVRA